MLEQLALIQQAQPPVSRSSGKLSDSTITMMKAILDMGASPAVIQSLLEFAELPLPLLRYLSGPIIFHGPMWADNCPAWVRQQILKDRLALVLDEYQQEIIGHLAVPADVMAYLSTASMEAPLYSATADCYFWCGSQVIPRHYGYSEEQFWQNLGCKPLTYEDVKFEFEEIASKIRASVVKHATHAGVGKRDRKPDIEELIEVVEQAPEPVSNAVQLGLF